MNEGFKIPPYSKSALTHPSAIAERLSTLVGVEFKLSHKTRTDGANARKLIATTLEKFPLPIPADPNTYSIMPPKRKGMPRILREYIDTYIVTTGDSYNLQVWNRNPVSDSVQIEYAHGGALSAKDVRFVFVRVDSETDSIRAIIVLTPEYIEEHFGRFGKPTLK